MNVLVFGATGTIGQHVVSQAIEKGYKVTAFSRNAQTLSRYPNNKLTRIEGDVYNPSDIDRAMKKQEAVIVVLGAGKDRKGNVRSVGTKNIIASMKRNNVTRIICQTTLGVGGSKNNLNFFWKNIMFGWFLKEVFLDHELQEKYISESNLNWTIVRPSSFTNGIKTQKYLHGFSNNLKSLKLKISRADVADFILKELVSKEYLHKRPGVSN